MRSVKRGQAKTAKTTHVEIDVKQPPNIGIEVLVLQLPNASQQLRAATEFVPFSNQARERKPCPHEVIN